MKKIVVCLLIVFTIFMMSKVQAEEVIIPDEAIRLRVIPNSNEIEDQWIKTKVRDNIQKEIYYLLKDAKNIEEARTLLKDNMDHFEIVVEDTLKENKIEQAIQLNYGFNYFPQKEYKGVTYDEGYYESIVITLGKGEGDNWWCVLFPPLCLLEADESQASTGEVEYKFFVKELIDRFFKNES